MMKIRKIVSTLIIVSMAAVGFTGCTKVATTGMEGIEERGKMIVGLDDQFPPMGFRDEKGDLVGFDIELANEVGKRLGVEVEFKPIVWDTKQVTLDQGEIDMIWNGFTITPERKEQVLFTEPYLENKQVIIVKEDSDIKWIPDLKDKKVAVQLDSSAQKAVEKNEETLKLFKELKKYENNVEILMDVEIGGIDAAVMDSVLARYTIKANDYKLKVLDDDFGDELYGIGLRKADTTLAGAINKELAAIKADGTFDTIYDKWFE